MKKIVRMQMKLTIEEIDENDNTTYLECIDGLNGAVQKEKQEYNKQGLLVYYKNLITNEEESYEYDDNKNLISIYKSNSIEKREYDENNNLTHVKKPNGDEEWYTYNKYNKVLTSTFSNGNKITCKYDEQ